MSGKSLSSVIRVRPEAGLVQRIEEPGGILVVREGGFPGVRIFFDQQVESFTGEKSEEAVNGAAYARQWSTLWVIFPAHVDAPQLVLEVWHCATPVLELRAPLTIPQSIRHVSQVSSDFLVSGSETAFAEIYSQLDNLPDAEVASDKLERLFYTSDVWIGGGICCDSAFDLRFFALMPFGVPSVEVGKIVVATTDANGRYSASFETGMARSWVAGAQPGNQTPWPRLGLSMSIKQTTAVSGVTIKSMLLYARGR